MAWPAPARAAETGVDPAWIVAGLSVAVAIVAVAGAAVVAAVVARRLKRAQAGGARAGHAAQLEAAFEAAGVGAYYWPRGAGDGAAEGATDNLGDLLDYQGDGPLRFADLKALLAADGAKR